MNEQDIILIIKQLEGSLGAEEQRLFDEKMAKDANFRAEVNNQTQTTAQLKELLELRQRQLHQSLQIVAQAEQKRRKRNRYWAVILGLLLAGGLAWWGVGQLLPSAQKQLHKKRDALKVERPQVTPKPNVQESGKNTRPNVDTGKGKTRQTVSPKPALPFYLVSIPEYVFYSGNAFVGAAPNEEKRRVIKIYTQLPQPNLQPQKAYYQFTDTLSVYGKTEKDIGGLVHEQSLSRFGLVVGKDSIQLQINDVKWRALEK